MNNKLTLELTNIINQELIGLGFNLVKISIPTNETKTIQILIERLDNNSVSISDCSMVSKYINTLLQVNSDLSLNHSSLIVSSAGSERPLITIKDYERFVYREVKLKLKKPINDSFKVQGKILKIINNEIVIETNHGIITLDFDMIKKANLVLTEEMFKKLLNKK